MQEYIMAGCDLHDASMLVMWKGNILFFAFGSSRGSQNLPTKRFEGRKGRMSPFPVVGTLG